MESPKPFESRAGYEFSLRSTPARKGQSSSISTKAGKRFVSQESTSAKKGVAVAEREAFIAQPEQTISTSSGLDSWMNLLIKEVETVEQKDLGQCILGLDYYSLAVQIEQWQTFLGHYNGLLSQCMNSEYYQQNVSSLKEFLIDFQVINIERLSRKYGVNKDEAREQLGSISGKMAGQCLASPYAVDFPQWRYQPEDLFFVDYDEEKAVFTANLGQRLAWLFSFNEHYQSTVKMLSGQSQFGDMESIAGWLKHQVVQLKKVFCQFIAADIGVSAEQAESLMYELTYIQNPLHQDAGKNEKYNLPAAPFPAPRNRSEIQRNNNVVCGYWYHNHLDRPYPSDEEKEQMAAITKATVEQITTWFNNKRRPHRRQAAETVTISVPGPQELAYAQSPFHSVAGENVECKLPAAPFPSPRNRLEVTMNNNVVCMYWYQNHPHSPYPNDEEKAQIASITRATVEQISTWFNNARRRFGFNAPAGPPESADRFHPYEKTDGGQDSTHEALKTDRKRERLNSDDEPYTPSGERKKSRKK